MSSSSHGPSITSSSLSRPSSGAAPAPPTFPLPDGFFPPFECSPEEAARWKALVVARVRQSLEEERPFRAARYAEADAREWKFIKAKDQLRVYRPRRRRQQPQRPPQQQQQQQPLALKQKQEASTTATTATAPGSSSLSTSRAPCIVLGIGVIDGTLEDVIYGVHHATTADMRATTSYLSPDALDSAVLHAFELGHPEDPFRSLALKWRILETPLGGLVANRDGCVLEYMGLDVDAAGERFAFHVSETVAHPACPPFAPRVALRADAYTRMLYRELGPGRVGVYFRGEYDLGGRLPQALGLVTVAELAFSVRRSVQCAHIKKLTAMALARSPIFEPRPTSSTFVVPRRRRSDADCDRCGVCARAPRFFSTKSMSWCKICARGVCPRCRARTILLSDGPQLAVECCKECVLAARHWPVDPTRPLPLVSHRQWLALVHRFHQTTTPGSGRRSSGGADGYGSCKHHSVGVAGDDDGGDDGGGPGRIHGASYWSYDGPSLSGEPECDGVSSSAASSSVSSSGRPLGADEPPLPIDLERLSVEDLVAITRGTSRAGRLPLAGSADDGGDGAFGERRRSLYSQMRWLRARAEDVYAQTRANATEFLSATPGATPTAAAAPAAPRVGQRFRSEMD